MKLTGYPQGRLNYVIDHVIPLCAGGADNLSNLVWQEKRESYRKDREERALCKALKKGGERCQISKDLKLNLMQKAVCR